MKYDCIIFYYQQHVYFATYFDRKGFKILISKYSTGTSILIFRNRDFLIFLKIFKNFYLFRYPFLSTISISPIFPSIPQSSPKSFKNISNFSKNLDFYLEDLQYKKKKKKEKKSHVRERNVKAKAKEQQ